MNKEEIKKITSQLKEILNKYPDKQHEILLYVFGRDNLMRMINEPTYEQLQQENKQLKEENRKLINNKYDAIYLIKDLASYDEDTHTYCDDINYYDVHKIIDELEEGVK